MYVCICLGYCFIYNYKKGVIVVISCSCVYFINGCLRIFYYSNFFYKCE